MNSATNIIELRDADWQPTHQEWLDGALSKALRSAQDELIEQRLAWLRTEAVFEEERKKEVAREKRRLTRKRGAGEAQKISRRKRALPVQKAFDYEFVGFEKIGARMLTMVRGIIDGKSFPQIRKDAGVGHDTISRAHAQMVFQGFRRSSKRDWKNT